MFSDCWIYIQIGLHHVLDIKAYDHVLFLIALTVPNTFRDWKRVLLLVSVFTVGHTFSLLLSVFGMVILKISLIEFLIPITILLMAFINLITAGKSLKTGSTSAIGWITLFFGILHGLGFSSYFNSILAGSATEKLLPSLEFALGIESAQIIVVLSVLTVSFVVQNWFGFSKRDWTLIISSFVIGVVVPIVIERKIW
jgi:hypothetical protein